MSKSKFYRSTGAQGPGKSVIVFSALVLAFSLALLGGWSGTVLAEEGESVIRLAFAREPQTLDVQKINWSTPVHPLISEPPIRVAPDGGIASSILADFRLEEEGKVWVYELPDEAKFSDGTPLDAETLKKSILRYIDKSPYASDWSMLQGYPDDPKLEVVDETTLKLYWEAYPAYTVVALASTYAGVVNPAAAEEMEEAAFGRDPVTLGPFKLESWQRGQKITLKKNEHYRTNDPTLENGGPPHVDKLVIRYIPEDLTRVSELEAGNVDMIYPVPSASLDSLRKKEDIKINSSVVPGLTRLGFNCEKEPFDDPQVRTAISYAIDREQIASYLNNMVIPRYGFLSSAQLAYSEETEQWAEENYGYDPEKARQMLEEAGYGKGDIEATLLVPSDDPLVKKIGVVLQGQLSQVGVKVNLTENPSSYIREKAIAGEHEMALMIFSWSDPNILKWVFNPESDSQYAHWNTEEAQKMLDLLQEGRKIVDVEERTATYSQIQKILLENHPAIPIFTRKDYYAYSTRLQNLKYDPKPEGRFLWNDVKVEED